MRGVPLQNYGHFVLVSQRMIPRLLVVEVVARAPRVTREGLRNKEFITCVPGGARYVRMAYGHGREGGRSETAFPCRHSAAERERVAGAAAVAHFSGGVNETISMRIEVPLRYSGSPPSLSPMTSPL